MDQFLSTYKKDYIWPSSNIKQTQSSLREGDSCRCTGGSRELKVIDLCGDAQDWSRIGPMGRLLDPKLYPAKTGPSPEVEATKFDQPSTYLKKLEEKYPNLYGILQSSPMDEITKMVDEDRMKTTYQVDYSERAIRGVPDTPGSQCHSIEKPLTQECRASIRAQLKRDQDKIDKELKKKSKRKEEDDNQKTRIPPWKSEYQDNISRLGEAILKTKMHERKRQGPAWATAIL